MSPTRIRCGACGTEQEAPEDPTTATCEICGASLSRGSAGAPIELIDPEDSTIQQEDRAARLSRTLQELVTAPPGGAAEQIRELVAATRRAGLAFSLVPVWGLWRLWQSEEYTSAEKIAWGTGSLVLTSALFVAIASLVPGAAERALAANGVVQSDFQAIAAMVDQYATENGSYPNDDVWARTVERGDARFLDPWNRFYRYRLEPDQYALATYGKDGEPGGSAEDADVSRDFPRRKE